MKEAILSAGIDIGTSTTQLIISQLIIKNVSGFGVIPKIEIIDKKIIYRSNIYFTPLLSENEIDGEAVKEIIKAEYIKAGIKREDLATGAIIITGESSRKKNAKAVVHAVSEVAGDFIVAVAGPNLESVLAGKGSGAAALSEKTGKLVANLDIGGGTTNICYLRDGLVVDMACLDIGGRLIKIEDGRISYISSKVQQLLKVKNTSLRVGDSIYANNQEGMNKLSTIVEQMVQLLEQSVLLGKPTNTLELMKTNQLITCESIPDTIIFSGGVADCIHHPPDNKFLYGDIGVLLGEALSKSKLFRDKIFCSSEETLNATVIGAGNYSMEVSGSTIEYNNCPFPIKNIPVVHVDLTEDNLYHLRTEIKLAVQKFKNEEEANVQFALAIKGLSCPSFAQLEIMADEIAGALEAELENDKILILVLETDIGKALGQALKRLLPREKALLCIDHISCHNGDYIDFGYPIASGKVIPVVVKTLVFNS